MTPVPSINKILGMNSKLLLRIAAVLIAVHLLGHSAGHSMWKQPADSAQQGVVQQMIAHKANFMGAVRSLADYYEGYSLMLLFVFAMSIWVLWTLSKLTRSNADLVKKILYPFSICYIAFGLIEFSYFFPFAAATSLVAGILMLITAFQLSKKD